MKNPFIASALLILALVGLLVVAVHHNKKSIKSGESLPQGATQIEVVGSGWYEFTYKNKRILLYQYGIGDTARAAMVEIGDK